MFIGNSYISNIHIYNTGHLHYWKEPQNTLFGGIYIKYSHGLIMEGCYFDDVIVVLKDCKDCQFVSSRWLLGEWNSDSAMVLFPDKRNSTLGGLEMVHTILAPAPSFEPSLASGQSFIHVDERTGSYSTFEQVFIQGSHGVKAFETVQNFSMSVTHFSTSVRCQSSTCLVDLTPQLFLPRLQIADIAVTVVHASSASTSTHTLSWHDVNVLFIAFEAKAVDAMIGISVQQFVSDPFSASVRQM